MIGGLQDDVRNRINEVLVKYGLDPERILQRSLGDDKFYEKIVLGDNDKPKYTVAGDIQTKRVPWPDGCWGEIQEAFRNG